MNMKSIDWFQSAQLLAIIVGVFLVAYELRQAREISQAQIASDGWALGSDERNTLIGDHGLEAVVKGCYDEPLSPKESYAAWMWFTQISSRVVRLKYHASRSPPLAKCVTNSKRPTPTAPHTLCSSRWIFWRSSPRWCPGRG